MKDPYLIEHTTYLDAVEQAAQTTRVRGFKPANGGRLHLLASFAALSLIVIFII